MKRLSAFVLFVLVAFVAAACDETSPDPGQSDETGFGERQATLDDWILGSDFGIESGVIDDEADAVRLNVSEESYSALSDQDMRDIWSAVSDIVDGIDRSGDQWPSGTLNYSVVFVVDGEVVDELSYGTEASVGTVSSAAASESGGTVANLVFIHHSVGENWLNDGLCQALNQDGYHVADIYYGWREYGDNTDTADWPTWFTEGVMDLVYMEMEAMTAPNTLEPADGENTIVMFKSCFPNSDVGSDISDEMAIYDSLLPYFEQHPDKMFVLCTPPPMQEISDPQKTRELCDWLVDSDSGWLADLSSENVFVFDLYNVLTDPDAHHQLVDQVESHVAVPGHDTLYYDSDGDDHPNTDGNTKAAAEFIGLLDFWYQQFLVGQ